MRLTAPGASLCIRKAKKKRSQLLTATVPAHRATESVSDGRAERPVTAPPHRSRRAPAAAHCVARETERNAPAPGSPCGRKAQRMKQRERNGQTDLGSFLDEEVYPALFERLDAAFPAFHWVQKGEHWVATSWPPDFPYPVSDRHPDRLMVYPDRPWWIKVHGHSGVRFLDYVNGGRKPEGPEFI